jgi:hypothetical protein
MADLKVTITEQVTLPNKNIETSTNFTSITGVNQITRRVDTISTAFSGTGIEILKFVNSEEEQVAGSFVKDEVKYVRITNLSTGSKVDLYLQSANSESVALELPAGRSMMLGNISINASSPGDYVEPGYVEESYYGDLIYYDTIKAKASGSSVQIEYLVASS